MSNQNQRFAALENEVTKVEQRLDRIREEAALIASADAVDVLRDIFAGEIEQAANKGAQYGVITALNSVLGMSNDIKELKATVAMQAQMMQQMMETIQNQQQVIMTQTTTTIVTDDPRAERQRRMEEWAQTPEHDALVLGIKDTPVIEEKKQDPEFIWVHVQTSPTGRVKWKGKTEEETIANIYQVIYELKQWNGVDVTKPSNIPDSYYFAIKTKTRGVNWNEIVEQAMAFARK